MVKLIGAGSSPRLRGTPQPQQSVYERRGIIPALAGNTLVSGVVPPASWDHPRACGEHGKSALVDVYGTGSSPRLRGTPAH
ncbi:hypothetical protein CQR51_1310 [Bifidobacterium pseudolongum subsp. globosum]|nr:hypothetical protein CQR51_1310 [Bifidobacterium pseudolongum subsp. globosum]